MIVKLKHMGKQLIPMTSLPIKEAMIVKNVVSGMAVYNHYQITDDHGLTLSVIDEDFIEDGEYDLPLKPLDFFPVTTGINYYDEVIA